MQQLRAEATELEKLYSVSRLFLRRSHPLQSDHDLGDAIETLRRENAALRKRLRQFLDCECRLDVLLDGQRSPAASTPALDQPRAKSSQPSIQLKKALSVEECHAIARKVYSEIVAFSAGGGDSSISTGASVFGWADQRRVDNGLLKFSLSKRNTQMSPEEASATLWALSTSPDGHSKLNSPSMDMRSLVVQVVDHSNVVIWEEYQVHSNVGGVTTVTIVRALVLLTLFATESGYILLAYGLDPELATYPANDYLSPSLDGNTIVKYAWQPVFCWTELKRLEGVPNQCLSSFVGTFPVEGANFVHWAVEVLLMVLRAENILLGPQWTLPQQEEVETKS